MDTANWLNSVIMSVITGVIISPDMPTKELKEEESGESLARCRIRIRNRDKKLEPKLFLQHLERSNEGLPLEGAVVFDHFVIKPAEEYKVVILGLRKATLEWLETRDGKVFFDIDYTRIMWDGLSEKLNQEKKRKLNEI